MPPDTDASRNRGEAPAFIGHGGWISAEQKEGKAGPC